MTLMSALHICEALVFCRHAAAESHIGGPVGIGRRRFPGAGVAACAVVVSASAGMSQISTPVISSTCMCVCVYVCMCVRACVLAHARASERISELDCNVGCMYTFIHACMHTYMHACMCEQVQCVGLIHIFWVSWGLWCQYACKEYTPQPPLGQRA